MTAKETSSTFAPEIAQITFYYNKSLADRGKESLRAACISDYQVGNCTLHTAAVNYIQNKLMHWDINATGLVQPALSKTSLGSAAGKWKVRL